MVPLMMAIGVLSTPPGVEASSENVGRSAAAAASGVVVSDLLRSKRTTSGQPIRMPRGDVEVVVSRYVIAPRASLPAHRHDYPRYGYVLAGRLRVENLQAHFATVFDEGSVIVEDVGTWHRAENIGDDPVELLVVDFVPPTFGNVVPKPTD